MHAVPDVHSPTNLLKWRLPQNKRFTGQQTSPPTSVCNLSCIYPILELEPPAGVSLIWTVLWVTWRWGLMVSQRLTRCCSRRNFPTAGLSLKLGGGQSVFRRPGNPSNTMRTILYNKRRISWAIYLSQFGQQVMATMSPPTFLTSYISTMSKTHIDLPPMLIT